MVKDNKLFSYRINNDALEIKMVGEIDHHSAVSVRADIDAMIFEQRPKRLILDLSEISFMDSSGLGLIMGRYSLVRELGGTLLLRSPTAAVTKILSLAGMERIIKIEKAFEEDDANEEN
ncbi:MAG: anti-sigma factor antagonist [Clostridia bacterium]|nr:anti-sigma factor antagonist [Clostridia bacterium]MBR3844950.1 anti-sigma factor antagonist [Clostridia bacterium]